jgi:hypothetical protein
MVDFSDVAAVSYVALQAAVEEAGRPEPVGVAERLFDGRRRLGEELELEVVAEQRVLQSGLQPRGGRSRSRRCPCTAAPGRCRAPCSRRTGTARRRWSPASARARGGRRGRSPLEAPRTRASS